MRKKILILISFWLLCVCSCQNQMDFSENKEKGVEAMNNFEEQDDLLFLVNNYGFDRNELEDYDLEKLINDYQLRTRQYTSDEIREILSFEGDVYLKDGTEKVFSMLSGEGGILTVDDKVSRIGYYYNMGTFVQKTVFDLVNGVCYVDNAESRTLTNEQIQTLSDLARVYDVFSWQTHYEGAEASSTGNFRWKLVFELDDSSLCVYDGYTQDMSHLPNTLMEVSATLLTIAGQNR